MHVLQNMTNRAKILKISLMGNKEGIFFYLFLKFGNLSWGWNLSTDAKCQHNISIITPAWPKNTGTWE